MTYDRTVIRLRQVALVAHDLDATVRQLESELGVVECSRDPGIAEFGLHNALMMVGDQFLEVVSPTREGTTAGRLLDKRGGDGGYMAIYEVDDLDARLERLASADVRVVWAGDFPDIRGRHLHPRDVGGTLVSIDQPVPAGSWRWGGPHWSPRHGPVVSAIAGVVIGADDPASMAKRWRRLGLDCAVAFVAAGERGEGLDMVDLVAVDRTRVGERHRVGGVTFRFV